MKTVSVAGFEHFAAMPDLQERGASYPDRKTSCPKRETRTTKRVGSTDRKRLSIKAGSKIVTSLDPIVRKKYRYNPAKLAAWIFASHVQRDPQPSPSTTNPPANPTT